MISNNFKVSNARFHLTDKDKFVIGGWFAENNPEKNGIEAYMDKTRLEVSIDKYKGYDVRQRHLVHQANISEEYYLYINLPKDFDVYGKLIIYTVNGDERISSFEASAKKILLLKNQMPYCVDTVMIENGECILSGWVASTDEIDVSVQDENGRDMDINVEFFSRKDVAATFKEAPLYEYCGFKVEVDSPSGKKLNFIFKSGGLSAKYEVDMARARKGAYSQKENKLVKGLRYLKKHGIRWTALKALQVVRGKAESAAEYEKWLKYHSRSELELDAQRKYSFTARPKFSIVVPLYKTPENFLREMIDSVTSQTYSNWELCMCEGSGTDTPVIEILREYSKRDERIKYTVSSRPLGISDNTNEAIKLAEGDFIVLVDHDDLLTPDALFECAMAIEDDADVDVIYSDEDKLSMDGSVYFQPHFKPDFNIDLLRSMNYITHLFVASRDLMHKVGLFRNEFDGSQDYDMILRCTEKAKKIHHIPRILYHWRSHKDSVAENPESKLYAYDSARKALDAHYTRMGIDAHVEFTKIYGIYKTFFHAATEPLVSVIISSNDSIKDIKRCISAIEFKSLYDNYEIIIVDTGSRKGSTFSFYDELQSKFPKVKVVFYRGEKSYSKSRNFGAENSNGEYMLFMDDTISIITDEFFEELLGYSRRNDVGAVGAKLYYEDDIIYHAGSVVNMDGITGNAFQGQSRYDNGYFARAITACDYSITNPSCFMTSREVFLNAGGFSEEFSTGLTVSDYCLRIGESGKLTVFNPFAEAYRYEPVRPVNDSGKEGQVKIKNESEKFRGRWKALFSKGDPMYNRNLSLSRNDYHLKKVLN